MRLFTIITVIFVVVIAAGSVYLHIDTKRFISNLPQPPRQDATSPEGSPSPQNQLSESTVPSLDTLSTVRTQRKNGHEMGEWWDDDTHAGHTHEHPHDPWEFLTGEDNAMREGETPERSEQEALLTFLINKFGDIPEVHLFVEASLKLADEQATVEDLIEYYEVKRFLYPSPEVDEAIQIFKEARAAGQPVSFEFHKGRYQPPLREPDFSDVNPFFRGVSPAEGLRRLRQVAPGRAADVEAYFRSKALEYPEETEKVERVIKESYESPAAPE